MQLRAALRETLEGWQEDIASPWRDVITDVALGFEQVDATLELEPWEPIFPARRGRTLPGAPAGAHMLRAFDGVAPEDVRCVILGQDPYPCPAFATGRAFEAGNVARWRELDKMFSPSVRAFVQLIRGRPDRGGGLRPQASRSGRQHSRLSRIGLVELWRHRTRWPIAG